MDTETPTQPQQHAERSYYIVFDSLGKIYQINSSPFDMVEADGLQQIVSKNPVCKKITQGKASLKKYGMIWDVLREQWDIDLRSTTLVIESKNNKLLPIQQDIYPDDADIFVKAFYNSSKLLIEANTNKIKSSKNLGDITEISTNETNLLDIFLTKKNDPDYLISTIKVDPLPLFKEGIQVFELGTNITKKVDWNNISLYTKQVFNDYGWSLSATRSTNRVGIDKIMQVSKTEDEADININVVDNTMYVTSKLNESQMYYFKGQTRLKIIVCDTDADNFVGAFEIPTEALVQKQSSTETTFDWPAKPILIYKNNYVTINTGDIHEQNAKH